MVHTAFIFKDYDHISPYFPYISLYFPYISLFSEGQLGFPWVPRIFRQTRINQEVPTWSHGTNEAGSIMSLSGAKIWGMAGKAPGQRLGNAPSSHSCYETKVQVLTCRLFHPKVPETPETCTIMYYSRHHGHLFRLSPSKIPWKPEASVFLSVSEANDPESKTITVNRTTINL